MKRPTLFLHLTSTLLATLLLADDKILPVVASGNQRFQQPLRYHANEESDENTIIGDVRKDFNKRIFKTINNVDEIKNNPQSSFTFAFLKNSNQKFFKIERTTGVVKTTSTRLDREAICSNNVTCTIETDVIIYRNSSPQSMVKLMIEVIDINDNQPIFTFASISETLSEAAERGEVISVRPATDKDSSRFGVVRYFLKDSYGGLFEAILVQGAGVKKEGHVSIHLKGTLDRESKDFYSLELMAADGGDPAKTGSIFIDISISDENDNSPVFQNLPYFVEITENSTVVPNFFSVHALDKDLDLNGKVEYQLSQESLYKFGYDFNINKNTGSLQVLRKLDYERYDLAVLVVVANDLGAYKHSSTTSLTVSVIDINDNSPEIDIIGVDSTLKESVLNVEENSPAGVVVTSLHVLDLDSGLGGVVDCIVTSGSDGAFEIIKVTTNDFNLMITNEAHLDRELKPRYSVTITCKDSDVNFPLSSSLDITIDVTDINDNAPLIPDCPKTFVVKETNPPGLALGKITAYDIDANENGTIEYYLSTTTDQVADIHPKEGTIRIIQTLDREIMERYDLKIFARDEGGLESTCAIVLEVTDIEDCDPEFEESKYFFTLHGEHFNPLHPIGQVRAVDRDLPPANVISYKIISQFEFKDWSTNDSSDAELDIRFNEFEKKPVTHPDLVKETIFEIKSNTGLIHTARPLRITHDNESHFTLIVMATSGIEQLGSSTAEIHIDISRGNIRHRSSDSSKNPEIEMLLEVDSQSEDGAHYLKIPLLLGLTCVLVGMTIFIAIVIVQAICSKLSVTRPANNSFWTDDKHQRTGQSDKPFEFNGSNIISNQNDFINKSRSHLSKAINLTQHMVKPLFNRNRGVTQDGRAQEKNSDEKIQSLHKGFGMSEERQNCLLDSLVTSSSTSSQSLLYSPRHVSGYKPSLDSRDVDAMDTYKTNTLPVSVSKDRRSSGYYSPSRSIFSAEEGGVVQRNGSRKSTDSGRLENRKSSLGEEENFVQQKQATQMTDNNSSILRFLDNQKFFPSRSNLSGRMNEEDHRFNSLAPPNHKPMIGRFMWYHDV